MSSNEDGDPCPHPPPTPPQCDDTRESSYHAPTHHEMEASPTNSPLLDPSPHHDHDRTLFTPPHLVEYSPYPIHTLVLSSTPTSLI